MVAIKAKPSSSSTLKGQDFGNRLRSEARPSPHFHESASSFNPRHDNDHVHFRDVQILPTTDEILAINAPVYMPKKDDATSNPVNPGPERFLDLLFRHLRFESTEVIRDICYAAAQVICHSELKRLGNNAVQSSSTQPSQDPRASTKRETMAGNRYFLYSNAKIEELQPHEQHTALIRISYDCPRFLRGMMLTKSGRFEEGMMIALLLFDRVKNELSVRFLQISQAQSTMSMNPRGGKDRKGAVLVKFLPDAGNGDALYFARLAQDLEPAIEMHLIEFPKLLPTGFYSPLKRLQAMHGFAFEQYLSPCRAIEDVLAAKADRLLTGQSVLFQCLAPEYARDATFTYDLSAVLPTVAAGTKKAFTVDELHQQSTLDLLLNSSTLDEGQAAAFRHCLTTEFAFTQGPPGTGKTYLGIQLARVLLQSQLLPKPILIVCLTNHALDSFLGGLKAAGVTNLLRIGGGSKEEWTQAFNLRERARKIRLTASETKYKRTLQERRSNVFAGIHDWCRSASSQTLNGTLGWYAVDGLLATTNPSVHAQLKLSDNPASQKFLFEHWAEGGDLETLQHLRDALMSRQQEGSASPSHDEPGAENVLDRICKAAEFVNEESGTKSVWQMSPNERKAMLRVWQKDVDLEKLALDFAEKYSQYEDTKDSLFAIRDAIDLRAMAQASVIGITTTGCASRWKALQALGIEVVICEEAGEVMEPHALCSLVPSVQHAIFIGDPLQLRPEVSEQRLVLERSYDYRLNESLFERMIAPKDPSASAMAYAQLTIQRRMHPAIAEIPKLIYPALQNHESTYSREPTAGIEERMFWWDHCVPEVQETGVTKSHVNKHEVDMVSGLVDYLLKGSAYSQGDIAVLTPYSGQLAELHKSLSKTCQVWLSDDDRKTLLDEEALDVERTELRKKESVQISDMLRLTTVDNFQGEEAAVVIISTVRSGTRPGFLASENRINVACSRARNGFYIIGNSKTLSVVPMWRDVIKVFGPRRGRSLRTYCSSHPAIRFVVKDPKDFASIVECPVTCGKPLACGHVCERKCHPMKLHDESIVPCISPCEKNLPCGHRCTRPCGVDCGTCLITTNRQTLKCGHEGSILCSGQVSKCEVKLEEVALDCGHRLVRLCRDEPIEELRCVESCSTVLPCGHVCGGTCSDCQRDGHPPCAGSCLKPLRCGHDCLARCCHEKPCPPCLHRVSTACEHGTNTRACHTAPRLCFEPQSVPCEHIKDSKIPCCLPRSSLPCAELCSKVLECGHPCPSLHQETCIPPSKCTVCMGLPDLTTVIYMKECNHAMSVSLLDKLNLQDVYQLDAAGSFIGYKVSAVDKLYQPKCICGKPCPSVHRYQNISKLITSESVLKRAFAFLAGDRFSFWAKQVTWLERNLASSFDAWSLGIRPDAVASSMNSRKIQDRLSELLEVESKIAEYGDKFIVPFEKALIQLRECMPLIFKQTLTTKVRFGILELRLSTAMVADNLRMAQHLTSQADPSLMAQRMSEMLLQVTVSRAEASRRQCLELLGSDSADSTTALRCELQLRQIHLWLLVDHGLGMMPDETWLSEKIDEYIDHKLEDIPGMVIMLDSVAEVSRRYPANCGSFSETARHFKDLLQRVGEGQHVSKIPSVDITSAHRVEDGFSKYTTAQHLTLCEKGHPFFEDVFGKERCPECGTRVKFQDEIYRETSKHLREDDFVAAMHLLTSRNNSPQKAKGLPRSQVVNKSSTNDVKSKNYSTTSNDSIADGVKSKIHSTSSNGSSSSIATSKASRGPKAGVSGQERFLRYLLENGMLSQSEFDRECGISSPEKVSIVVEEDTKPATVSPPKAGVHDVKQILQSTIDSGTLSQSESRKDFTISPLMKGTGVLGKTAEPKVATPPKAGVYDNEKFLRYMLDNGHLSQSEFDRECGLSPLKKGPGVLGKDTDPEAASPQVAEKGVPAEESSEEVMKLRFEKMTDALPEN